MINLNMITSGINALRLITVSLNVPLKSIPILITTPGITQVLVILLILLSYPEKRGRL